MAGGPLPPQNIEAEQSVLGSLLLDTDAVLQVSPFLLPQDFYQESHRQIYQAILDLHEKRQPSDLVTLTDELERRDQLDGIGGAAYLASLTNAVPSPVHVEHYGHIVERIAVLRRLISASGEIAGMAYEESEDVDQIIDHAEEIIFGVAQRRLDRDLVPLSKHLEEYYDYIEQVSGQKGEIMGLPTGYDDLDKLLAGLQKSDLVIVAGRPGMGKTSLALSIAFSVAQERNARIALFSLEMPAQQLAARLICAATDRNSRVDSLKLRSGKLTEHQLSEVMRAMGDLSQYELYIDDSATLTPMELRAKARRLHAEKPLDLVIVDYLQLMRAGIRAENRVREVSYISQQLKALARELRVPILACSQLSRAVELRHDKRPVLSDLRESGCLTGETLITRADTGERIPMKDLAEREEQTPIPVFALDERYRLVVRPMTKVFPSGRKRLYQLRTRSGRTIRASANHPFRTIDGWQALADLSSGSRIALPRHLKAEQPENPLSNSELALLAHLLGDGCTVPRQPIHYTSADEENIRIVERAANRLFNIDPRRVRQKNWWHVYLPSPYRLTHGKHNPITR
ncbi:MAG: replicative DNA helicase, partial [Anaerolineae bacterium]